MEDAGKRQELTAELKSARYWILAVGIILVVFTVIMFEVEIGKYDLPADILAKAHTRLAILCAIVLAFFVGCFFLARVKPVLGCVLALIGYWLLQFWDLYEGGSITNGIVIKVLFTMALVKGIKSASRAEQLQSELGKVFE
jgi:hypothetical protein